MPHLNLRSSLTPLRPLDSLNVKLSEEDDGLLHDRNLAVLDVTSGWKKRCMHSTDLAAVLCNSVQRVIRSAPRKTVCRLMISRRG